ncbi:MAG: hypothetical protein ACFFAS_17545 [Promethearchaeota archaeon]
MSEYDFFMVFALDDSGDRIKLDVPEDDLQSGLHPEEVLVVVKEPLRRIFIWKGAKSPVRKRFISSRVAGSLQEELVKQAAFHRCKIVSVDQGDEPVEFLRAFNLESMEVTEKMEDMRYVRNIERETPERFGNVLDSHRKKKETSEEEYYSPAIQELKNKCVEVDVSNLDAAPKKTISSSKSAPKPSSPKPSYAPYLPKRTSGLSEKDTKAVMDKVLSNDVPSSYIRQNLIIDSKLYGAVSKSSNVFGESVEKTEWEPITQLPKGCVELDGSKLRIYINDKQKTIDAIEILLKLRNKAKSKNTSPQSEKNLNTMTVKELKEYSSEHDIEIPGSAKKADIIKIIKDAEDTIEKPKSSRRQLPKIPSSNE